MKSYLTRYGPGGYRFTDFVRVGLPLDLICAAVAITLIPMIWPLTALLHTGSDPENGSRMLITSPTRWEPRA
jgi:hypothetical protein